VSGVTGVVRAKPNSLSSSKHGRQTNSAGKYWVRNPVSYYSTNSHQQNYSPVVKCVFTDIFSLTNKSLKRKESRCKLWIQFRLTTRKSKLNPQFAFAILAFQTFVRQAENICENTFRNRSSFWASPQSLPQFNYRYIEKTVYLLLTYYYVLVLPS